MVEHIASGRKHHQRQAGAGFPVAAAGDVGGLWLFVSHVVDDPHPHRDFESARARADAGGRMSFWAMGGYAAFIWPAYGVSALGLALAVIWTLKAYGDA